MKKFFSEFKKFITRGNVVDLAVGVIIGSAFTAIVNSLVKDIVMPFINMLTPASSGELRLVLREEILNADGTIATAGIYWNYGNFLQAVINFILIALVVFLFVKLINNLREASNVNAKISEAVQKKLDNDEPLNKYETKWLNRYSKKHPEKAPKKNVPLPEEPVVEEPTPTEKLLMQILDELKNKKSA